MANFQALSLNGEHKSGVKPFISLSYDIISIGHFYFLLSNKARKIIRHCRSIFSTIILFYDSNTVSVTKILQFLSELT
ncbi:hypothetical protein HS5_03760 [Acidianus sp. HS-5]|nr:hypothetical protein HS5_03760 [Acidianus sp. HS-5]